MKFPRLLPYALLFTLTLSVFPQEPVVPSVTAVPAADERAAKLRASAVEFLRETYSDVGNMRSLENRISFTAELAALLWYQDKNEAAAMFGRAVGDFKQLLAIYDSQMNSLRVAEDDADEGFGPDMFMREPTDAARIAKKFRAAVGVRQQVAMSIAEHEPDLAFNFFHDSINSVTNAEFRKQLEESNARYEQELISRIAATNAKKGAELGIASLKRGFNSSHIDLLKKIYAKDAEKGVEFGRSILSAVKSTSNDKLSDYDLSNLLKFGSSSLERSKGSSGSVPVYSESDLREIADILARGVLSRGEEIDPDTARRYAASIQPVLPARAMQIRAKYPAEGEDEDGPRAPTSVYTVTGSGSSVKMVGMASGTGGSSGASQREAERQKAAQALMEGQEKLKNKELPKEERERIVSQARGIIAKTSGRANKIMGLSALATTVAAAGDRELASEIMRDAAGLVNPQPKNYQDMMTTLMLAAGYANAEPEKAFPLLDDTIYRTNELISSVAKLAEFADINEEIIADGEFQVGAFGGQMIKGMTAMAGMADSTLKNLIDADFEKTKALANRFDRSEIRVLAKVLILRSILDPKKVEFDIDDASDAESEVISETYEMSPPPPPPPAIRRP